MKVVLPLVVLFGLAVGQRSSDGNVHAIANGSQYHYSWVANPSKNYNGNAALQYCRNLGSGWNAVGISSQQEWIFLRELLERKHDLDYFWTGGIKSHGGWRWATGEDFGRFNVWSRTGGLFRSQPDNRDPPENCLGVLKQVYNDGITWHDIHCRHQKPVVCEKI